MINQRITGEMRVHLPGAKSISAEFKVACYAVVEKLMTQSVTFIENHRQEYDIHAVIIIYFLTQTSSSK